MFFNYLFENKLVLQLKSSIENIIEKLEDQDTEIKELKESLDQLTKKYEELYKDYQSLISKHTNLHTCKRRI